MVIVSALVTDWFYVGLSRIRGVIGVLNFHIISIIKRQFNLKSYWAEVFRFLSAV